MIIQWGRVNAERNTVYHNFPISFTSAETWIGAAQNSQNINASASAKIFRGTSGTDFVPVAVNTNGEKYTDLIDWLAIGY